MEAGLLTGDGVADEVFVVDSVGVTERPLIVSAK